MRKTRERQAEEDLGLALLEIQAKSCRIREERGESARKGAWPWFSEAEMLFRWI